MKPGPAPRTGDPASLRNLDCGSVVGFADRHGTHAWLGIPYAQPPVGDLRWKAPRPPVPWDGIRHALEFGPHACQPAGVTVDAPASEWGRPTGSEDCLTLNVFAPGFDPARVPHGAGRLPVMVWIHGGANTCGTSATYGMVRNLAGHDQVIVVSVNYRLGILGWFSLAELAADGDTLEDRSGNFGTLDLIAALEWVKRNIAAFGGDPDNVTIWGESAGGLNVYSLLASPLAKGLFHKAIAQSPLTTTNTLAQARHYTDDAEPGHEYSSRELLCRWLVRDGKARDRADAKAVIARMAPRALAAYVRGKTPAELLSVITPGALSFYPAPLLLRDGTVLPDTPLIDLFADRKRYHAVPLIVGANRDEYKLFLSQNPSYVKLLFGKFPIIRDVERYNRDAAYLSALWKAACVDAVAASMVGSGHPAIWVYRFDWDEQPPVPMIRPRVLLGASHVLEMSFVFRDLEGEFDPFRSNTRKNLQGRREVSDAMADYWIQFARNGAPGRGARYAAPEWKPWTPEDGAPKSMVFDTSADGGTRMIGHAMDTGELADRLAADPAFDGDPDSRCTLCVRMFVHSVFGESASAARRAGCCGAAIGRPRPAHWP
jgi:para-nitrobenzyl esterase